MQQIQLTVCIVPGRHNRRGEFTWERVEDKRKKLLWPTAESSGENGDKMFDSVGQMTELITFN